MILKVNLLEKKYQVILENGLLEHINDYYDFKNHKVLIVTDDGVPKSYHQTLLKQIENSQVIILEQGEKTKSIESFIKLQTFLLTNKFSRSDVIIALGGGVIGDLTAFVASTFKRGMKFINIPTTSLSQIDSSVGGKTAINFMDTKNVIGTFYQPELVLIDFLTLKTLSKRHLYNGLVEALKMGLIADEKLNQIFKNQEYLNMIEEVIYISIKNKIKIVEKDEKENHDRMILNFGHTLAHPFESINQLSGIYHGEAVANGMLYMIDDKCLKKEVFDIISSMQINLIKEYDLNQVMDYLENDKKTNGEEINVILVN